MSLPTLYPEEIVLSDGPVDILPRYPPVESVLLRTSGKGVGGSGSIVADGLAQLLAEIPVSALGIELYDSPRMLLTFETAQDALAGNVGCAFAISPTNISNVTQTSRDYVTNLSNVYFPTSTAFVLNRELDYPTGTSNVSVYITPPMNPSYFLQTSNAINYSFTFSTIA